MTKPILHLKISEKDKLRGEYFHRRGEFIIGSDLQADHCTMMAGLPRRFSLLKPSGKDIVLNFADSATGQITKGESTTDISHLLPPGPVLAAHFNEGPYPALVAGPASLESLPDPC